jgi:copper chaperone CopZ
MKKYILLLLPLTAALLLSACYRNDIRTATFRIDQLRTPESVQLIGKALQQLDGIQEVRSDVEGRALTVVFNGRQLYLKNIEFAIVNAGFSLPNWPAEASAKANLPEELQ